MKKQKFSKSLQWSVLPAWKKIVFVIGISYSILVIAFVAYVLTNIGDTTVLTDTTQIVFAVEATIQPTRTQTPLPATPTETPIESATFTPTPTETVEPTPTLAPTLSVEERLEISDELEMEYVADHKETLELNGGRVSILATFSGVIETVEVTVNGIEYKVDVMWVYVLSAYKNSLVKVPFGFGVTLPDGGYESISNDFSILMSLYPDKTKPHEVYTQISRDEKLLYVEETFNPGDKLMIIPLAVTPFTPNYWTTCRKSLGTTIGLIEAMPTDICDVGEHFYSEAETNVYGHFFARGLTEDVSIETPIVGFSYYHW